MIEIVKLHVDTGPNGHACGIFGSGGHIVHRVQALDSSKVRKDEALEAPLPTENRFQQERVRRDRDTINLVVSSHYAHGVAGPNGRLERFQHNAAQLSFSDVHGRSGRATFRRPMPGKMFGLSYNGTATPQAFSLCSAHPG